MSTNRIRLAARLRRRATNLDRNAWDLETLNSTPRPLGLKDTMRSLEIVRGIRKIAQALRQEAMQIRPVSKRRNRKA